MSEFALEKITEDAIFGHFSSVEIDDTMPEEEVQKLREQTLIDSPQYADWAVRRIKMLRKQRQRMMEIYEAQKEQLERYRRSEESRISRNEEFWTYQLKSYFEQLKQQGLIDKKSYRLPHGVIGIRKLPDKWDFSEVDLHELYEVDPELVKLEVKKQEAKSKLEYVGENKAVHKPTGQVVFGVTVTGQENSFYVKPVEE